MQTCDFEPRLRTVLGTFLLLRQPPLQLGELGFVLAERVWCSDLLTSRKDGEVSQPKINADLAIDCWLLGDHIVAKQAHEVPPGGVLADRHGCDLGGLRYLARPSNGQRFAHLRQLERPSIPLERACRVLRRLRSILPLELRVACALGKEVVESGLQVAKRLLERDARHFVEPSVFGLLFERRKCRRSFVVSDALLPLHPCIRPKTKHVVVSKASAAKRLGKNHFLLRRRIEPEPVRSLDFHSHIILDLCRDSQPNGGCERKGHASRAALKKSQRSTS